MNWITGIQKAVDYVEANLYEKIDYQTAAKYACSSEFHFQRMFTLLCGYTLGDYIRMRRLTLAGSELISTNNKIIDIAFKYGYNSSESFSRAFSAFHGISPSEARKSGKIKSFSRISVKLILTGGDTMDYRIEKKGPLKILCKRKPIKKPVDDAATTDIASFWKKCGEDGITDELVKRFSADSPIKGLLGICFTASVSAENQQSPYGIGFAIGETDVDCSGFDVIELPEYTYAVFKIKGNMPDAFSETYKQICGEFFIQSDYEYAHGAELEVYPSADVSNPDYECEVWIAVNKKK